MRIIGAIAALLFYCSGCATLMTGGGQTVPVRIMSEPPGASVKVDGNYVGLTPVAPNLTRHDDHVVVLELAGYSPETVNIYHGANPWLFGNVVFGFPLVIVAGVVDITSGAGQFLYTTNVDVNFEEKRKREHSQ